MAKKTFAWPDYPCPDCHFEGQWDVRRCVNAGGHETFLFVCGHCGKRTTHFVSKAAVKAAGLQPEDIEPRTPRHTCAVCGVRGAENHHWAPWHIFGNEANRWPQSYLCPACHRRWHDLVTPNASTRPSR